MATTHFHVNTYRNGRLAECWGTFWDETGASDYAKGCAQDDVRWAREMNRVDWHALATDGEDMQTTIPAVRFEPKAFKVEKCTIAVKHHNASNYTFPPK